MTIKNISSSNLNLSLQAGSKLPCIYDSVQEMLVGKTEMFALNSGLRAILPFMHSAPKNTTALPAPLPDFCWQDSKADIFMNWYCSSKDSTVSTVRGRLPFGRSPTMLPLKASAATIPMWLSN
jgi:hypothetical protein